MKTILAFFLMVCASFTTFSQNSWTPESAKAFAEQLLIKKGMKQKFDQSVNFQEFAVQYNKNPENWDAAFAFIKDTKFDTLKVGKHPIGNTSKIVSVSNNNPLKSTDSIKLESHKVVIDIHYVFKGEEYIATAPAKNFTIVNPYNPTRDIEFVTVDKENLKFNKANSEVLYIYFPNELHAPNIKTEKCSANMKCVFKI